MSSNYNRVKSQAPAEVGKRNCLSYQKATNNAATELTNEVDDG